MRAELVRGFLVLVLGVLWGGCGEVGGEAGGWENSGGSLRSSHGLGGEMRIVSFVPSATRIVVDLGLGDRLVGVAEHDAAAPKKKSGGPAGGLAVVGSFMAVDYERLLTLSPTHVVFPQTGSGVPERLEAMAREADFALLLEPYPASVGEVEASVVRLGEALGASERAAALALPLREMQRVYPAGAVEESVKWPRVLLVFGVDPVIASGPGSINHELLFYAGARNAVGDAAVSAVTLDREALVAAGPEVVVLLLPGAGEAEARVKCAWFDGLPIPAVKAGRVVALTDAQVLLPSTNLPAVLAGFREAVWGAGAMDRGVKKNGE